MLHGYIPAPYLVSRQMSASVRHVTCLFLQLVDAPHIIDDDALDDPRLQSTVDAYQRFITVIQHAIVKFRATLRQMVYDDKGLVAITIVGLPPHGQDDRHEKGLKVALEVLRELENSNLEARTGVSSGPAFCGVVGNDMRSDFTVIGDSVNLAARIMGKCTTLEAKILCDAATAKGARAEHGIMCKELSKISVKGKKDTVSVFKVSTTVSSVKSKTANQVMHLQDFVGRKAELATFMNWFKYGIASQ